MFLYGTLLMNLMLVVVGVLDIYFTMYTINKYKRDKLYFKRVNKRILKEFRYLKQDIIALRNIGNKDFEEINDGDYTTEDLIDVKKNLYTSFLKCTKRTWERDNSGRLVRVD